jgi:hypothetical protein
VFENDAANHFAVFRAGVGVAKAAGGPTYPSGHSTTAAELVLLLGMIVPGKRDSLYERSDEYAMHPITSGAA